MLTINMQKRKLHKVNIASYKQDFKSPGKTLFLQISSFLLLATKFYNEILLHGMSLDTQLRYKSLGTGHIKTLSIIVLLINAFIILSWEYGKEKGRGYQYQGQLQGGRAGSRAERQSCPLRRCLRLTWNRTDSKQFSKNKKLNSE